LRGERDNKEQKQGKNQMLPETRNKHGTKKQKKKEQGKNKKKK